MKKLITLLLVLTGMVTTASAYYSLPGTWNSWTTTANQFTGNTVTIFLKGNTTYSFKFFNSDANSWSGTQSSATMTSSNCTGWWFNGGNDVGLETTIAGEYTFTLNWVGDGGTTPSISVTYPSTSTYTRGVTDGKFGTICLPYKATVTGATVYKIKNKVMNGSTLTGINLQAVDELVAGNAYIFKATSSTLTATLTGEAVTTATEADGMMGNISAADVTLDGSEGYYVIGSDNLIHKVVSGGAGVKVGQYKAYITLEGIDPVSSSSREANFIAFEDGEATGISQIENGELNNESYFDLQGRRVAQPTKGLYIVNGKKVIIK